MSGQTAGQIVTRVEEEIARRDLTNEDAAREIGVPERTLRRWRSRESEPRRHSRRLLLDWLSTVEAHAA